MYVGGSRAIARPSHIVAASVAMLDLVTYLHQCLLVLVYIGLCVSMPVVYVPVCHPCRVVNVGHNHVPTVTSAAP